MNIEVKHKVPVTVEILQVELPHYFKIGSAYCCMTKERKLIDIHRTNSYLSIDVTATYDCDEEVAERLASEFANEHYEKIDEAVFHHKFSEAYREVYYIVNPELRPKL